MILSFAEVLLEERGKLDVIIWWNLEKQNYSWYGQQFKQCIPVHCYYGNCYATVM